MFNKFTIRKLTKEDDISHIAHAKVYIERSIEEGLAYGAFRKQTCIGYIAPLSAMRLYNSGADMKLCTSTREMYEELLRHFNWVKDIVCIPRCGGEHIAELLLELYSNYSSDVILYSPYFNHYEEFKSAGFSSMKLSTQNKEILIK